MTTAIDPITESAIPGPVVRMPQALERELAQQHATETSTLYDIPGEASLDGEFTPAPDLEQIAQRLMLRHQMKTQMDCHILYLWRDKGGKSRGKPVYGRCTRPTGLLRHFSEADFVIWLAADHLREAGATEREVEAVVYHELLHIGEDEEGEVKLVDHEFTGFFSELRLYGTTVRDLKPLVRLAQQLELFDEAREA